MLGMKKDIYPEHVPSSGTAVVPPLGGPILISSNRFLARAKFVHFCARADFFSQALVICLN